MKIAAVTTGSAQSMTEEQIDWEYLCMDSNSSERCFHDDMMKTISDLSAEESCSELHREWLEGVPVIEDDASSAHDPMEVESEGDLSPHEEGDTEQHRESNNSNGGIFAEQQVAGVSDDNTTSGEASQQISTAPPTTQVDLRDCDVLGGRGGAANHHVGNWRYWQLILEHRETYQAIPLSNSEKKNEIAMKIYNTIIKGGSRFLEPNERANNELVELGRDRALEKIKRALRAGFVPQDFRDV